MRLLAPADAAEVASNFDLTRLPEGFHADPYPVYHALRMHAPVHRVAGGCVLSRHADLEAVYKDTATFSSDKKLASHDEPSLQ
jgi:cytochrome P450